MKQNELSKLNINDLNRELDSLKSKLFDLRCKQATGQLKNPHLLQITKKDIARILTCRNIKPKV